MEFSRYSLAMAVTTMVTVLIACTLIWLVVSEPVALATAVNDGDVNSAGEGGRQRPPGRLAGSGALPLNLQRRDRRPWAIFGTRCGCS